MKKIIIILLTLLMLVGCKPTNNGTDETTERINYYIDKIENFEVRKKNINNTVDNKEFDEFLDSVFDEFVTMNFLSMHYTVVDYKSYGVQKPEVGCGTIKYEFDEKTYQIVLSEIEKLESFDFDSLSYRQQYDYETLLYSDYETMLNLSFWKYNYCFSEESNVTENLVSSFSDYVFYDKEALDDYMICLADLDRYLDDCLTYTSEQAKDKIYLLDDWIDYVCSYCDSFVNASENAIITTFNKRIDDVDFLSDAEKQNYKDECEKIVKQEIIPAYKKVSSELKKYEGKSNYKEHILSRISPEYAKAQFYLNGSNNEPLEKVFEDLKSNFRYLESRFYDMFSDNEAYSIVYYALYEPSGALNLSAEDTLEYLRTNLVVAYPDLGNISYNVDYLSDELGSTTTKAYYYSSPIDDYNQNIIRINPNNTDIGYDTYSTLAHEGFPGHLYQHVYALLHGQHKFRSTQGFGGNTEGYAVMAQYDAIKIAGIDNELAQDALFFYTTDYFMMYSIIDMGVNYFGWSVDDIIKFFGDDDPYGIYSFTEDNAEYYYDLFIEMAGIYSCYGLGFSKYMSLRNNAKQQLGGKFDLVEFNDYVLKNGTIPFNILEGCIDEYIEANK